MPNSVPVYIPSERNMIAALLTPAVGEASGTAVLICAPWGWDEVASYRVRREWAELLAAAGHPVLRFDLPGVGDSSGSPRDPDLLHAWRSAVRDCADWLRERVAATEVAAIGLGLGGLLAREAISGGALIEQLLLWGAPARGRNFVRETRAFAGLQQWEQDDEAAAGGLEAGGFLLSAETLEALSESPPPPPGPGLRRVLLLSRDGVPVDQNTMSSFETIDDVTVAEGDGWAEFTEHPEHSVLPAAVTTTVADWLAKGEPAEKGETGHLLDLGSQEASLNRIEERPWPVRYDRDNLFGILAGAATGTKSDRTVIFLNAGAVRHTGPDRLWVELSREAASAGLFALRLDLDGIGEADGEPRGRREVAEFYVPQLERQVGAVLDSLESSGLGSRFMLVGLCAGGYWGYRLACDDRRVERAVLINAGALRWEDDLIEEREARRMLRRVFSWPWWRRLLSGQVRPSRVGAVLASAGRSLVARLRRPNSAGRQEVGFDDDFDMLSRSGAAVTLAFSADEPLEAELVKAKVEDRIARWPNLRVERLPGSDHTLRSLGAQAAARKLVRRELAEFAVRAVERTPSGPTDPDLHLDPAPRVVP